MRILWVLCLFVVVVVVLPGWSNSTMVDSFSCKSIESKSAMLRLKRRLFCDYDSSVRPTLNHQTVTNVTMKLMPKIMEFNEWTGTMTLHSWMSLGWKDAHLTWNPSDFEGISLIHINSYEVWIPDLSVYNSGDMSIDQNGLPSTNCLLFSSGEITCVPTFMYSSKCNTDFTLWPYDKHDCRIRFGSWSHTGEEINFQLDQKGFQMDGFTNNTQWDMRLVEATRMVRKFDCCPNDTFPIILYTFSLERHYGFQHSSFVAPAIALACLTLTVLWLDSRSTERVAVSSVNFICHLICIFDLHWQLPHNGFNPPNILLFYRDSLILASFALILTALLRKLQDMSIEAPSWISTTTTFVLNNRAGRFLILGDEEAKISKTAILTGEPEENTDLPKIVATGSKESPWRHFAALVEWISFFCVVFVYIVDLTTLIPSN